MHVDGTLTQNVAQIGEFEAVKVTTALVERQIIDANFAIEMDEMMDLLDCCYFDWLRIESGSLVKAQTVHSNANDPLRVIRVLRCFRRVGWMLIDGMGSGAVIMCTILMAKYYLDAATNHPLNIDRIL